MVVLVQADFVSDLQLQHRSDRAQLDRPVCTEPTIVEHQRVAEDSRLVERIPVLALHRPASVKERASRTTTVLLKKRGSNLPTAEPRGVFPLASTASAAAIRSRYAPTCLPMFARQASR